VPAPQELDAIRCVADGESVIPDLTREAHEAAVACVDDSDLPVLGMLMDGESTDAIAEALHADQREIAWRAQRIVGRLRPRLTSQPPAPTPSRGV
jgi:hypothetical protein